MAVRREDLAGIFFVIGIVLISLAVSMLIPAAVDALVGNPDATTFTLAAAGTFFVGGSLMLAFRGMPISLDRRGAFVLTVGVWVTTSAFAAIPFLLSSLKLNYTDAFFEAISGLTTTGSTILTGLEALPPGILLWRGILQWLGGIGIIAMAIAILPFLSVGGMQLYRLESSERSEKLLPRPAQVARGIVAAYLLLSLACAILYWMAGMSGFDAIIHAMTTLSTGGYSTYDSSIYHFASPTIEWIGVLFMGLGSLPFILYLRCLRGDVGALWRDQQVRGFLRFLAVVIFLFTLWLWIKSPFPFLEALRLVAFNVVSIVSTTGFVSTDYQQWVQGTETLFLLLTVIGGCTGSTSGALKFFRLHVLSLLVRRYVRDLLYPHAVSHLTYNAKPVSTEVAASVAAFFFVFIMSLAGLTLALSTFGLDLMTSLSGAATALSNVGPGLGRIIGPAGNFDTLPDPVKWLLSFGMLLGRLELFTVLIFIVPRFWRP